MVLGEIFPNILAMISSLFAMLLLGKLSTKIGGILGKTLKLLIIGIFFSVFVHAAAELAYAYEIIPERYIMLVMGSLLTLGSICFVFASMVGLKALK